MINIIKKGMYLLDGNKLAEGGENLPSPEEARKNTIAYSILSAHNTSDSDSQLRIRFDALASHDITYVGIFLTARATGHELGQLKIPYVLTNCHNSLCAVGGTINEDDHMFGLSAAKKFGAIYVPAHQSVIHSFMREMMSGCGKMILGSDSHTRYGALGTMGIGEGGPELVKQLFDKTYEVAMPKIVAVKLTGKVRPGVGPHDVAIALIGAVYSDGIAQNAVLEFVGDGVNGLPIEFRNGIDVMTTETKCLSSIWTTDDKTKEYFRLHGREGDYKKLAPGSVAYYDGVVEIDLSKLEPMIALPFHPSNAYTIRELNQNAADILREVEKSGSELLGVPDGSFRLTDKIDPATGRVRAGQGVIAGCAGGIFDNLTAAADILRGKNIGNEDFALSVYPASQPAFVRLIETGDAAILMRAGATMRSAFCGPCFGAGDVPANGELSLRHSTRNFPNREGSKPGEGQIASVALMDARSIAATAAAGGLITAADELDVDYKPREYAFDRSIYENRVYFGFGKAQPETELVFGPNIKDWPDIRPLPENLMMTVASVIGDEVTTTDELIPSGESSSFRSNPYRISRLALSRRDPEYVGRCDVARLASGVIDDYSKAADGDAAASLKASAEKAVAAFSREGASTDGIDVISTIVCARRPGDGSAREYAATCQRVLGGGANLADSYATKRYRSNLINWGMLPLTSSELAYSEGETGKTPLEIGDFILIPEARAKIAAGDEELTGYIYHTKNNSVTKHIFSLGSLSRDERNIIISGCLMKTL